MIPELPELQTNEIILNALGEPSLQSLGLGCWYTPVGWVQQLLDFIHVNLNLPWWEAILLYTIVIRILMIPLTIRIQKAGAELRIYGPQMAKLSRAFKVASKSGDQVECKGLFNLNSL